MNTYKGKRFDNCVFVWKNEKLLWANKSLRVRDHSPNGFEWGYCGSGPAQLALALLLEEVSADVAEKHHQQFKSDIVAGFQGDEWEITSKDIWDWLHTQSPLCEMVRLDLPNYIGLHKRHVR